MKEKEDLQQLLIGFIISSVIIVLIMILANTNDEECLLQDESEQTEEMYEYHFSQGRELVTYVQ